MGHWLQPSFPPCDFLLAHLSVRAWLRPEFCRDAAPGNLINRILIDRSSSLAHAWSGQSARPRSGRLPDRMPTRAKCDARSHGPFGVAHGGGCLWITGTIPRILAGARRCPILTGHRIITAWPHALSAPISR